MTFTAAIAGASGYAGGEILRLLSAHPYIRITTVTAHSQAGSSLGVVQPHLRSLADMTLVETTAANLAGHDVVFLALPHGHSGAIAAEVHALSPETILVDCGADHRLHDQAPWDQFYGGDYHPAWTYGVPELLVDGAKQREALRTTKRIAAPGCNASTVSLALAPGIAAGVIDPRDLVAVLAVGPSGAGRALKTNLLASEIMGSASPYAVGGVHRHIPEIQQALREAGAAQPVTLSFTPVLVPMSRGILATCTARLGAEVDQEQLRRIWQDTYGDEEFVELLPAGQHPATAYAQGANTLLLSLTLDKAANRVVVIAALDNLTKGTAGAAIQSVNLAMGLPENAGLTRNGVAP